MKRILASACFVLAAFAASSASAVPRTWPGVAPCDLTLQACIDASSAGDSVLVASNTPIAATVFVNKPLTLRAAQGYRPVIADGFAIAGTVNVEGEWRWQVEGFTLERGFISLNVSGGSSANVVVRGNHIESSIDGVALISVYKPSAAATTLHYDISGNRLAYFWDTFDGALNSAMQVLDGGTGSSEGIIRDNRVIAAGNESIGILVSTQDRNHRVAVAGNHVVGGRQGSIFLRQGSLITDTGGTLTALVTSNVVRSRVAGSRIADGIKVDIYDGTAAVDVLHNTVVDAYNGIDIYADAVATASGNVAGNLLAYLTTYGLQRSGTASGITDSQNLFFQTWETPASAGINPDSIFADPRLRGVPGNPHLLPDSPAIDMVPPSALVAALDAFDVPRTDGDGLRRIKRPSSIGKANPLDIGALEAGDTTALHRAPPVAAGATMLLDMPEMNGIAGAAPQITQNWNPEGETGIYNNHPLSMFYVPELSSWGVRQEDLAAITPGARFNIFAPGAGVGRYFHDNTPDNTGGSITELDNPDLNNREDAIVLVVRNPGDGSITDLTSPQAVNYFSGVWSIVLLDGSLMPDNGRFHVYFQEPSINAFVHRASAANILFNSTGIEHPLLDGHRCARFHVTQATDFGVMNNHHIGVYFAGNRWWVFNQDGAAMPAGAQFHVVVDPQAVDCPAPVFADGFE